MAMDLELRLRPIGRVVRGHSGTGRSDAGPTDEAEIEIDAAWAEALDGLEQFSHIWVVWWLDRAPLEDAGPVLRVRPERRAEMPLVGVFATRSPCRPNPIALTAVRLLERRGRQLRVQGLDAFEGSPIVDIKPYLIRGDAIPEAIMAPWVDRLWAVHDCERGVAPGPG